VQPLVLSQIPSVSGLMDQFLQEPSIHINEFGNLISQIVAALRRIRDVLLDVIKNANITIPPDLHPTTEQLGKIAHEIVEGGHPNKILNDIRQNKS
jgi:hypothetical protein